MGDRALLAEVGEGISPPVNRKVRELLLRLETRPVEGLLDLMPSYRSLLLVYDPLRIPLEELQARVMEAWGDPDPSPLPAAAGTSSPSRAISRAHISTIGKICLLEKQINQCGEVGKFSTSCESINWVCRWIGKFGGLMDFGGFGIGEVGFGGKEVWR